MQLEQEKLYYQNVRKFLLWAVSIVSGLILFTASFAVYISYSDRSKMMEDYNKQITTYQTQMEAVRKESKEAQNALLDKADNDYGKLKDEANKELSDITNDTRKAALNEAIKQTNEIFEKRNFDRYVDSLAQKRIEPKVKKLVDDQFAIIDKGKDERINKAVSSLLNDDVFTEGVALNYLTQEASTFTSKQVLNLLDSIEQNPNKPTTLTLTGLFTYINSKPASDYLIKYLTTNATNSNVRQMAWEYLLRWHDNNDFDFYKQLLTKCIKPESYFEFMELAQGYHKPVAIRFLNEKNIIDKTAKSMLQSEFSKMKQELFQNLKSNTNWKSTEYNSTYLFSTN